MRRGRPLLHAVGWRWVAPFAATAAVVAGSAFLYPTDKASPPAASPLASGSKPQAPPLDARTHGWQAQKLYSYGLKLTTVMTLGQGNPSFDFDVLGALEVEAVSVTEQSATLYAVVRDPEFVSRIPAAQAELDQLAAELARDGFFFELKGGLLSELRVAQNGSPLAVNMQRTLAAALQVARPASEATSYEAEEYDTTGRYQASYAQGNDGFLQKKKLRYTELLGPKSVGRAGSLRVVPRVQSSEIQIKLTADGRPERVRLAESIALDAAQTPVASTTTLALDPRGVSSAPASDRGALYAASFVIAAGDAYGKVATEALDRSRIGTLTFEQIVPRLEQLAKDQRAEAKGKTPGAAEERANPEESKLFIALAAIFRQQPETVPLAVSKIRSGSPISGALVDALGSASSPESQRALIALLNAKDTKPELKSRVSTVLGRTAAPTEEAVAALQEILVKKPWNRNALFGLGTLSRHLRDAGEMERAARLGDLLVAKLDRATDPSTLVTSLRAIANSGYAPALPKVVLYLKDSREQIRVDAVRALQSMKDPKADELIAAQMHTDSPAVCTSAIQAAEVRVPTDTLVRGVRDAARSAPDPHVRYRAIEVMLRWLAQRPELRGELVKLSSSDQEPRIRERIAGALAAGGKAG